MKHCFWLIFTVFLGFPQKSLGGELQDANTCLPFFKNPDDDGLRNSLLINDTKTAAFYIAKGANIDGRYKNGATLLIKAVKKPEIVKFLLNNGANPNLTMEPSGWTALHYAANDGQKKSVDHLLAAGADRDLKTATGHRAVDLAESRLAWFKSLPEDRQVLLADTIRDYEHIIHTLSHSTPQEGAGGADRDLKALLGAQAVDLAESQLAHTLPHSTPQEWTGDADRDLKALLDAQAVVAESQLAHTLPHSTPQEWTGDADRDLKALLDAQAVVAESQLAHTLPHSTPPQEDSFYRILSLPLDPLDHSPFNQGRP